MCSLELVFGLASLVFGAAFGLYHWKHSAELGMVASSGTVMLATLPVILGFQLLLAALTYDVNNIPRRPLGPQLGEAGYDGREQLLADTTQATEASSLRVA